MVENKTPEVCVVGGGIAGLSAAVFLANEGVNVTLIEASPKFGGRAYSFFDKELNEFVDNGQHILASWYKNTFEFLDLIGSNENIKTQDTLQVTFADKQGKKYNFKCPKLPPPLHLVWGIFGYDAIGFKDKVGIVKLVSSIKRNKFTNDELKAFTVTELFHLTEQSEKLIDNFWKPFVIAIFNAEPDETNAWYFAEMIKLGFLSKGNSKLVLPLKGLNELYVEKSIEFLEKKNACIKTGIRVKGLKIINNSVEALITENNDELKFDYYISAVPFFEFKNLIGDELYRDEYNYLENLKPSPIVNVHLKYFTDNHEDILKHDFIGILNSTIQWVFKVNKDRICIVISSANEIAGMNKENLVKLCIEELKQCIPEFRNVTFTYSKVVKEMRATFLPDISSLNSRPANKTKYNNFFIAGDWTDTGYPATIEGAVLSARKCADEVLKVIK
ncbi:MAG: FAD-dependent oxidoreductase [Ignavibacteriae bacterium]|nr:MAG: FAD-dependent oxidoreductase [Ignavibacteriota bacterium]